MLTAEETKAAEEAAAQSIAEKVKADTAALEAAGINTDAGKEAIRKERDARRTAEKSAKDAIDELNALRAQKAEADAAKAAEIEAEAIRKGEFETLATKRADEIKAVTAERDALQAKIDTLIAAVQPGVTDAWKALPDEIKSFYDGADDDVLAKRAFLAKSQPAIDKLAAQRQLGVIPKTPRPNGITPIDAAIDDQRRSGKYKI
jgi:hypothetical protein